MSQWPMVSLSEVIASAESGVWFAEDAPEDGISILRSTNFTDEGLLDYRNLAIKAVPALDRARKLLRPGDILVERSGGGPNKPVGRVVLFDGHDEPHVFGNFVSRIRAKSGVQPDYLFWSLFWLHACGQTERLQKQTTGIRNLEWKRYLATSIAMPPITEQCRIVDLLNRAVSIRRLRETALERAHDAIPALFLSIFGDPATNPMGWDRKALGQVIAGFQGGKNLMAGEENASPFRILKISAVTGGRFKPSESKPAPLGYTPGREYFIRKGDLLITRANTADLVGAVAYIGRDYDNLLLPDKIWRFVWKPESFVNPGYVEHLFRTKYARDELRRMASGTSDSMRNIAQAKLLQMSIPLPPKRLQEIFAGHLADLRVVITHQEHALALARDTERALMAKLLD